MGAGQDGMNPQFACWNAENGSDSQADDEECHDGVLQAAMGETCNERRVEAATATRPVLGREDERCEPEVGKDDVEWQQISPV